MVKREPWDGRDQCNISNKCSNEELITKIENAYKIYKLSETFLNDVTGDYGKQKIARLRLEFAQHELITLLQEASNRGIKWDSIDMVKKFFFPQN